MIPYTIQQRLAQLQYLYLALFKLYEFADQNVDALRVLLAMNSPTAVDYFAANSNNAIWSYFNLKKCMAS